MPVWEGEKREMERGLYGLGTWPLPGKMLELSGACEPHRLDRLG